MYYLSEIKEQLLKAITLIEEYELRGFTIDRDTALELIRRAYEDLRFHDSDTLIVDESEAHITPIEQSDEPEVEVEIIMSEEGEEAEETEEQEEQEEQEEVAEQEEAVEAELQEAETDEPEVGIEATPEPTPEPEPEVTPEPTPEPTVETVPESEPAVEKTEPEVGIETTPEPTPEPEPEVVEVTTKAVVTEPSLFGDDDQWTRPTHSRRRLISLYRDEAPQEPKPRHRRKSADVEPKAEAVPETPAVEKVPTTPTEPTPIPTVETTEPTKVVLADTISTPQTIADTIQQQPSIGQSGAVNSLRGAISVGDRFMLIRELFGGDEAKYESTIDLLDSYDNLDDCIIYIAENFTWRASSDGAKLIMDLLQRKLS